MHISFHYLLSITMTTSSTARGLRLIKCVETYVRNKPTQWDTSTVFNNVKILSMGAGHLRGTFRVEPSMCNALDTLHGGYVCTVVDVLSMFGQMSHDKGKLAWTTNLNVVFLKAAFKGEQITVDVTPLMTSPKSSAMEVILTNDAGALVAKGVTSFQAGSDRFQQGAKEILGFDVNEKYE